MYVAQIESLSVGTLRAKPVVGVDDMAAVIAVVQVVIEGGAECCGDNAIFLKWVLVPQAALPLYHIAPGTAVVLLLVVVGTQIVGGPTLAFEILVPLKTVVDDRVAVGISIIVYYKHAWVDDGRNLATSCIDHCIVANQRKRSVCLRSGYRFDGFFISARAE